MKKKNPIVVFLLVLDLIVTLALMVFNVGILVCVFGKTADQLAALGEPIRYIVYTNPVVYLIGFALPMVATLVLNFIIFARYFHKKAPIKVEDLTDEEKEALRQQLEAK